MGILYAPVVIGFIIFAFAVATGVVLVRTYLRTRFSGFLWLLLAAVIWPFSSRLFQFSAGYLFAEVQSARLPSWMLLGQTSEAAWVGFITFIPLLIGGSLLLIAVVVLDRQIAQRPPVITSSPGDGQQPWTKASNPS